MLFISTQGENQYLQNELESLREDKSSTRSGDGLTQTTLQER